MKTPRKMLRWIGNMGRKKTELKPLIPLRELKRVVKGLVAVPKEKIAKPKGKTKKRARRTS